MAPNRPGRYRLSPHALGDLDDIWQFSANTWSTDQADRYIDELASVFAAIAAMPALARERLEFTPPVRIHTHESHLIVYQIATGEVVILRVLSARQDWLSILKTVDS